MLHRGGRILFFAVLWLCTFECYGKSAESKAIWVIKGNNCRVENIEFSNCRVPDNNGAGIRMEGTNLTVSHCYFTTIRMGFDGQIQIVAHC